MLPRCIHVIYTKRHDTCMTYMSHVSYIRSDCFLPRFPYPRWILTSFVNLKPSSSLNNSSSSSSSSLDLSLPILTHALTLTHSLTHSLSLTLLPVQHSKNPHNLSLLPERWWKPQDAFPRMNVGVREIPKEAPLKAIHESCLLYMTYMSHVSYI